MPGSDSVYGILTPESFKCNPYDYLIDGSGGMGDVYKAFDTRTYETVAVKVLKQGRRNDAIECVKEGKQLRIAMPCPNVINLIGIFATQQISGLVMEFAENGSLDKLIHNKSIKLEKDLKFRFLSEIAAGIHFLHNFGIDQRVLHRDIKPKNLLLDMDFRIKIADFGTSVCSTVTDFWNDQHTPPNDKVQTLAYCAPERLRSSPSTSKVDIYSFGVSVWEIIVREQPYHGEDVKVVRSNVLAGGRPNLQNFPGGPEFLPLKQLVEECWHQDCDQRPDALSIKKMLKTNCPYDHIEVANQVHKLHMAVPKKNRFTEEMAKKSLLETVNRHNQQSRPNPPHQQQPNSLFPSTPSRQTYQGGKRPQHESRAPNGQNFQWNRPPPPPTHDQQLQFNSYGRNDNNFRSQTQQGKFHNNNSGGNAPLQGNFFPPKFSNTGSAQNRPFLFHHAPHVNPGAASSSGNNAQLNNNPPTAYSPQEQPLDGPGLLFGQDHSKPQAEVRQSTSRNNLGNGLLNTMPRAGVKLFAATIKNNTPRQLRNKLPSWIANTVEHQAIKPLDSRQKRRSGLKCVVLGNKHVGKENLISMFKKGNRMEMLQISGQKYKVKVEKGAEHLTADCDVVIICFSPASRPSYNQAGIEWMDKHKKSAASNAPVLLVMTQTELHLEHGYRGPLISESDCCGLAEKLCVPFEEYRTNDVSDAAKIFKKAFSLATKRI